MRRFIGLVWVLFIVSCVKAQSVEPVLESINSGNVAQLVEISVLEGSPEPIFQDTSAFNDRDLPSSPITMTPSDNGVEVQISPDSPVFSLTFPEAQIYARLQADVSVDERFLAVTLLQKGYEEGAVSYVWHITTDPAILRISAMTPGGRITWRPDGQQVGIDSNIYDLKTGSLLFQHSIGVQATDLSPCDDSYRSVVYGYISWSPDSTRYAALDFGVCGSEENGFAIFDSRDGSRLIELTSSSLFIVKPLFWSHDGQRLASGPASWSATTGYRTGYLTYEQMGRGEPETLWLPDNRSLLSIDSYGLPGVPYTRLYKWEADTGKTLWELTFWQETSVTHIGEDTLTLDSGFAQLTIDQETGSVLQVVSHPYPEPYDEMAWSPDSQRLVTVGQGPKHPALQLWERETLLETPDPTPLWEANRDWFAHENAMETYLSSHFIPQWRDNDTFATVTWGYALDQFYSVEQWEANSGKSLGILNSATDNPVFLSPDQTQLIALPYGNQIQLLDIETQGVTATLDLSGLRQMVRAEWSPSGEWVALHNNYNDIDTDDTAVALWHVTEPDSPPLIIEAVLSEHVFWNPVRDEIIFDTKNIYALPDGQIVDAIEWIGLAGTWSPDGQMFVTANQNSLIFWDVAQGIEMARIRAQGVMRVSWSPDGQLIATIHNDGQLTLWGIPASR